LIKPLLEAGASLAVTGHLIGGDDNRLVRQNTCLHIAIANNDLKAVKLLLETSIDKTATNNDWKTSVEFACEQQYWDCAQAIIEKDLIDNKQVDVQYIKNMHYEEALLHAIARNNYKITKLLLDLNAPCSKENSVMGNVTLYHAFKIDNPEI